MVVDLSVGDIRNLLIFQIEGLVAGLAGPDDGQALVAQERAAVDGVYLLVNAHGIGSTVPQLFCHFTDLTMKRDESYHYH